MSKEASDMASFYKKVLQPETQIEEHFFRNPDFLKGLSWGTPRYGHPEGQVYKHIREVLNNIEKLSVTPKRRSDLRIIAMVHDTFKFKEHKGVPRDWTRHHAVFARKFLAQYHNDPNTLLVTELHDEAYYCWCTRFLYHKPERAQDRLNQLISHLGNNLELYYQFFWADTCTGDKNLAPLHWFEKTVPGFTPIAPIDIHKK